MSMEGVGGDCAFTRRTSAQRLRCSPQRASYRLPTRAASDHDHARDGRQRLVVDVALEAWRREQERWARRRHGHAALVLAAVEVEDDELVVAGAQGGATGPR